MATLINRTGGKHRFALFVLEPHERLEIPDEVIEQQLDLDKRNGLERLAWYVDQNMFALEFSPAPVGEQETVNAEPAGSLPPAPSGPSVESLLALSTRGAREFMSSHDVDSRTLSVWLSKETRKTVRSMIEKAIQG